MNFIEFHAIITQTIHQQLIIQRKNYENHEILRISLQNHENHENLIN